MLFHAVTSTRVNTIHTKSMFLSIKPADNVFLGTNKSAMVLTSFKNNLEKVL